MNAFRLFDIFNDCCFFTRIFFLLITYFIEVDCAMYELNLTMKEGDYAPECIK